MAKVFFVVSFSLFIVVAALGPMGLAVWLLISRRDLLPKVRSSTVSDVDREFVLRVTRVIMWCFVCLFFTTILAAVLWSMSLHR